MGHLDELTRVIRDIEEKQRQIIDHAKMHTDALEKQLDELRDKRFKAEELEG